MNAKSAHAAESPSRSEGDRAATAHDQGGTTAKSSTVFSGMAAAPRPPELPAVFGRYHVERLLDSGGMGSVYLAHDQQLGRPVALKIPRIAPGEANQALARLKREARSVAALQHPNICPVYDAGEIEGIHYLAMAFIQGHPLTKYLQSVKPQSERAAALTVLKIAKALAEAHRLGILHRDLKPANIMIDARGEPIVMDFGLAYRLEEDQTRLTQEGAMLGTPAYMSPEQIEHRGPIGPASDIYSLGVVLYELLTLRCPFEGSLVSVVGQILHREPPLVESRGAAVSPELADICRKAMAKVPAQRFGSMDELAGALAAFLRGNSPAATSDGLVFDVAAAGDLGGASPLLVSPPNNSAPHAGGRRPSLRLVGIALGSAAAVVLAIGLVIYASRGMRPARAEANSPETQREQPPAVGAAAGESGGPQEEHGRFPPAEELPAEEFKGQTIEQIFARIDRNGDGYVDRRELPLHVIWRGDENHDDALDWAEMDAAYARLQGRLFAEPTESELARLPPHKGGPPPGRDGPPPRGPKKGPKPPGPKGRPPPGPPPGPPR